MNKNNDYFYLARWASGQSEGVVRKIRDTTASLVRQGVVASMHVVSEPGLKGEIIFAWAVLRARAGVLILRARPFYMGLYFPLLVVKRLQGVVVIVDVPTPLVAVLNEVRAEGGGGVRTWFKLFLISLSCPVGLWPANRVLHYAPDSDFFTFGLRRKIKMVTNGIDVNTVKMRSAVPRFDGELRFIGVAQIAEWHGYDRMIKAVHKFNASGASVKFCFDVVGEGPAKDKLVALHEALGGGGEVRFLGFKTGAELDSLFEAAHVGVCSLGLYRIGLQEAAILKAREYVARGIPMLMCGHDQDFKRDVPFVMAVQNSDSDIDLKVIQDWYQALVERGSDLIGIMRSYALDYLDFDKKVRDSFVMSS